jgi:hypothetical protein
MLFESEVVDNEPLINQFADFLYSNPTLKRGAAIRQFAQQCGRSPRTLERWLKRADAINDSRVQYRHSIKDKELAKSDAQRILSDRERAMRVLWEIIEGRLKTVMENKDGDGNKKNTREEANVSNIIRAITELSRINRWSEFVNADEHADDSIKKILTKEEISTIIDKL